MKQALYIQPMTARDAAFAEGRKRGREEGLLYAIEQLDLMAESQRGKVATLIVMSQGYQDAADRLRCRFRAGLSAFAPKAGEP